MATVITWAQSSGGSQISGPFEYTDSGSKLSPGVTSQIEDLFVRHSSASTITECGFFIKSFADTYSGGSSKEADLQELFDWGNDDIAVVVLGAGEATTFEVDEVVTGGTSGATGVVVGIDTGTETITMDTVSGIFQSGEAVTGSVSGAGTIASTSDAGLYINQNLLDTFSDYTVLTVADSTDFAENLIVTGDPSTATGTVVKIEGNNLILSSVTGTFQVADDVTDTETGDSTVSAVGSQSAWTKFKSLSGSDKINTVQLTIDSIIGGASVGQSNGEILTGQESNVQMKLVIPNLDGYPGLGADIRQFSLSLAYRV